MILKPYQICKYYTNCKYHKPEFGKIHICNGTIPNRNSIFNCEFIDDNGKYINKKYNDKKKITKKIVDRLYGYEIDNMCINDLINKLKYIQMENINEMINISLEIDYEYNNNPCITFTSYRQETDEEYIKRKEKEKQYNKM